MDSWNKPFSNWLSKLLAFAFADAVQLKKLEYANLLRNTLMAKE
jgi:hypothetical protein